jgi:hypothetical protein
MFEEPGGAPGAAHGAAPQTTTRTAKAGDDSRSPEAGDGRRLAGKTAGPTVEAVQISRSEVGVNIIEIDIR